MNRKDIQFIPAAKTVILFPDMTCLMGIRSFNNQNYLEPFGGCMEVLEPQNIPETFEQCAMREIQEETGLKITNPRYIGSYSCQWNMCLSNFSICVLYYALCSKKPNLQDMQCMGEVMPIKPIIFPVCQLAREETLLNPLHFGLRSLLVQWVESFSLSSESKWASFLIAE